MGIIALLESFPCHHFLPLKVVSPSLGSHSLPLPTGAGSTACHPWSEHPKGLKSLPWAVWGQLGHCSQAKPLSLSIRQKSLSQNPAPTICPWSGACQALANPAPVGGGKVRAGKMRDPKLQLSVPWVANPSQRATLPISFMALAALHHLWEEKCHFGFVYLSLTCIFSTH